MCVKGIVCDYRNLYNALKKCKRGVSWKDSVAGYWNNALLNIKKLQERLLDETYSMRPFKEFYVHEPKLRLVQSIHIEDRVFAESICENYFYNQITRGFIYDSAACLRGKGTEFALKRLKTHLQRFCRRYGVNGYVLQVDVKNFFGSTPHDVAIAAVRKRVKDEWAVKVATANITAFSHGKPYGIGLGSRINQLVELAVIDDLDHIIKEKLHIKYYIRYNDDLILIHHDKQYLKRCLEVIKEYFTSQRLEISVKKTHIKPVIQPIHFLGFSFRLTHTVKVIVKLLHEKISRERRKLKRLVALVVKGIMTRNDVDKCYAAWKAHASGRRTNKRKRKNPNLYRHTHSLILSMDKFYKGLWQGV